MTDYPVIKATWSYVVSVKVAEPVIMDAEKVIIIPPSMEPLVRMIQQDDKFLKSLCALRDFIRRSE